MTGRFMDNFLGHLHFWPSLVCMNLLFFPMLTQGMAGFHRRWYNGGEGYIEKGVEGVNVFGITVAEKISLNEIMTGVRNRPCGVSAAIPREYGHQLLLG
jgi:cytochrome c oxidase subunit 1